MIKVANQHILIFLIVVLVFVLNSAFSQNVELLHTQSESYFKLPSETGAHNKKWLVNTFINSKKILKDLPIRSYLVTGDYQLKRGLERIYVGGGIGVNKMLTAPYAENEVYATIAYHRLIQKHSFYFGIQPALLFRNIDSDRLIFPDQYDRNTGGFNPDIFTGELINLDGNNAVLNLNFGAAYGIQLKRYFIKAIIAGRNLNRPSVSFTENENKISANWIGEIKADYYLTNQDKLEGFCMIQTYSYRNDYITGAEINHVLRQSNLIVSNLSAGSKLIFKSNKVPNNIVFNLGFGFKNSKLGLAYGYNLANSTYAQSFNTFEIMLSVFNWNRQTDYYSVPCEIY